MKGILGRKVGMTEVFTTSGKLIPVTVIKCEPNVVIQQKEMNKDGVNSIQLGLEDLPKSRVTKPKSGHTNKVNTSAKRFLKEIKNANPDIYKLGEEVKVDIFEAGEKVDVTAVSKGKGFAGAIKRHGYQRQPMSHGSKVHRSRGSLGDLQATVFKGTKMPGHMGNVKTTIQNLTVVSTDLDENIILIKGSVPGPKKGLVLIKSAIKNTAKEEMEELVDYSEKEVQEEIKEEVKEVEKEETTEVTEEEK